MANWRCHASRDLPLNTDTAWDGAAATKAMLDAANIGDDNPDFAKARRGFLLVDDSAKELRGSYSLPFADIVNGTLTALISGCRAAASRLSQKDGVSDAESGKARAALDAYFAKAKDGEKATDSDQRGGPSVCAVWAPISRILTSGDEPPGSALAPFYDAVKKKAQDPSIFDERPPYLFRAHISNRNRDAYYTRMHESSLQNYAADASDGVNFQNSHRETELGFGRSYRGEFLGSTGNGTARTEADFYTVPGLNLNGIATSDLIDGIRAGLVKDVSIGFYGATYRCATCERELFHGECWHIPGFRYDKDGKPTDDPDAKQSVAWVHDARLAEVSAVYDGACPGAAIMKARQVSDAGYLRPEAARLLETRYRINLPASQPRWPGADVKKPKENSMPDNDTPNPPAETLPLEAVRAVLHEGGVTVGTDPLAGIRTLIAEVRELRPLKVECERLRPLAEEMLESACCEGVRYFAAAKLGTFADETQRAYLRGQSFEFIRIQRDQWKLMADQILGGGRTTQDAADPPPPENGRNHAGGVPAEAFRSR